MSTGYMVSFHYTNHRGEFSRRTVEVDAVQYLREPGYGYEPGWFVTGICQDKQARRSFALSKVYIPTLESANLRLIEIAIAQGTKRS